MFLFGGLSTCMSTDNMLEGKTVQISSCTSYTVIQLAMNNNDITFDNFCKIVSKIQLNSNLYEVECLSCGTNN